jgi:hypothetical protein
MGDGNIIQYRSGLHPPGKVFKEEHLTGIFTCNIRTHPALGDKYLNSIAFFSIVLSFLNIVLHERTADTQAPKNQYLISSGKEHLPALAASASSSASSASFVLAAKGSRRQM